MADTLPTFLKQRAERSYRNLLEQLAGLTSEDAMRGRRSDWPDHPWGIGQDGSIAGIVFHVAAWKQLTLPLFQGQTAIMRVPLDETPNLDDWQGILAWLKQVGTAWNAELAYLPKDVFEETRDWGGKPISVARLIAECYEHDIQHASQIEFLRMLYQVEDAAGA